MKNRKKCIDFETIYNPPAPYSEEVKKEIEKQSKIERKQYFRPDGSCTDICPWGYAVEISTGLCICLEGCREEFGDE